MAHIFGSIWDRFNRNALNALSKSVEQQGKSIQDLVAEGQLTPTQYSELIKAIHDTAAKSEVRLDTSLQPINVSEMDTETKQLFTGGSVAVVGKDAVGNENIKEKSVSADKLNFLNKGINQFNGDFKRVSLLTDGTLIDEPNSLTAIIPVIGGKTYYLQKDTGNRRRVAFHKSKPNLNNLPITLDYYEGDNPAGLFNVIAPTDAKFLIYTVSYKESVTDLKLQITEDESHPFFVGYDFLTIGNINGLNNEFDKLNADVDELNAYVDELNSGDIGVLYGNSLPILKIDYSDKHVTVPSGSRIYLNGKRVLPTNLNVPIPLTLNYTILYINYVTNELGTIDWIRPLPHNSAVIAIINPQEPMIFGVDIEDCEVNGKMFVREQTIELLDKRIEASDPNQAKYFFLDDLRGVYDKPVDISDGSSGTELDLINSDHSVIYDIYDNLLTKYPSYISSRVIGQDSNGLDIHEYSFTAPRIGNSNNFHINVPKIIMISAIHGYEQASAYSTAMFFKDLVENWGTKEQLEFLRWNVDFVVIPVANPDGYDNNRRINNNGVDPNRNFWEGTRTTGTPGDDYFGGFEGMAEPEVKAIAKMIDENLDADFYIDYHNIAGGYPMAYTYGDVDRTLMNSLYRSLSKKWAKDYPEAPQDGTMMGYISGPIANASVTYASKKGVKSTLLETPWTMPFADAKYDKITLETGAEALGNLIVTIVKSLK